LSNVNSGIKIQSKLQRTDLLFMFFGGVCLEKREALLRLSFVNKIAISAAGLHKLAPAVLNVCTFLLFVRLLLTMPSRGAHKSKGGCQANVFADWRFRFAAGGAPERQRTHSVGAPKMSAEMRLIGKAGFRRHIHDRETFVKRQQELLGVTQSATH
jgi:hypothetical protein